MFPSNVLPLHIFESRYKEMFEDALRGDQLVAMATLMPGFEHDYYSRPPVCPAICIGRVIAHERTPQGTYNLMLAGLERAKIEHEIEPVRSFRRGKVTVIGSRTGNAKTASAERAEQLVAQIVKSISRNAEAFRRTLWTRNPTGRINGCRCLPSASQDGTQTSVAG